MKNNYRLLLIAAAALTLGACSLKEDLSPMQESIRFTSNLGAFTKATDTNFEAGDAVSLFAEDPITALNVKMNYVNGELVPERQIAWPEEVDPTTLTSFFAVYPYREDWEDYTNVTVFSVNADQRTHELYTASDLMGAAYAAYPGCETVPLNFTHRLSQFKLTIYSTVGKVSEVYLVDVLGKARMTIFHQMQVFAVGAYGTINMGLDNEYTYEGGTEFQWKAIVPPQGMRFKIAIVMENGDKYYYTPDAWEDIYMESGKVYQAYVNLESGVEPYGDIPSVSNWTSDNEEQFGQYVADPYRNEGDWYIRNLGTDEWTQMFSDGDERAAFLTVAAAGQYDFIYNIGRKETQLGLGEALSEGVYTLVEGGKPYTFNEGGDYVVKIDLIQETVTILPDNDVWSVIGEFGEVPWETDIDMVRESPGFYNLDLEYYGGEFKLRCNHSWDVNFGGYGDVLKTGYWNGLVQDGANMILDKPGKYTLIFDRLSQVLGVTLIESYVSTGFSDYLGTWTYGEQQILIGSSGSNNYLIDFGDEVYLKAIYDPYTGNMKCPFVIHNTWYWEQYSTSVYDYTLAYYYLEDGTSSDYLVENENLYLFSASLDGNGNLALSPGMTDAGEPFYKFMIIGLLQDGDYAGYYVQLSDEYPLPMTWVKANQ